MHDVTPDIVTMAKQIGNGFPLAAVVCKKEIADCMNKATFTTYGGNPVAMAAGREVLKVIEEEGLQENCERMGRLFMSGLHDLKERHEAIGDVRGAGLMIGIEVVTDKFTKTPDQKMFEAVFERTKEYGLLMGKGGRYGTVMRI
mmetsp:Transcript_39344/g.60142  ORF Transcript_39344/g.60142 Transcript_39344/m.60142 type:complete len:144 (+) Transcript_39344:880-1311(+)